MKKYTTPTMNIEKFYDENVLIGGSAVTDPDYVPGLAGEEGIQKAQVNLNEMRTLIKFSF